MVPAPNKAQVDTHWEAETDHVDALLQHLVCELGCYVSIVQHHGRDGMVTAESSSVSNVSAPHTAQEQEGPNHDARRSLQLEARFRHATVCNTPPTPTRHEPRVRTNKEQDENKNREGGSRQETLCGAVYLRKRCVLARTVSTKLASFMMRSYAFNEAPTCTPATQHSSELNPPARSWCHAPDDGCTNAPQMAPGCWKTGMGEPCSSATPRLPCKKPCSRRLHRPSPCPLWS